jgi:hypothetical protein
LCQGCKYKQRFHFSKISGKYFFSQPPETNPINNKSTPLLST